MFQRTFYNSVQNGNNKGLSTAWILVKGTDEKETVYYRVKDLSYIPQVGDEIQFSYSWLIGGCTPYPEYWAIWMGLILLALDGTVFVGYILVARKKKQGGSL